VPTDCSIHCGANSCHTDAVKKLVLALLLTIYAWPAQAQLRTQVIVSGLSDLVGFVADPLHPGVHYAVQQNGIVYVVQNGVRLLTPFLDVRNVISSGGERGLLGFVFPPNAATGRVFVNFTNSNGHTVVARFQRSALNPLVADAASRFDLRWPNGNRFITQPFSNHNGGHLAFGADGYLYIGMGDGGSSNDPQNNAQNPSTLLGKMLRIDVNVADSDPTGYRVPLDNPFLDGSPIPALGEIWSFGLRNPWRYSFDDPALGGTGAMFLGDVGQVTREEIDYEPAGGGGRNYGWRIREGTVATPGVPATTPAFTPLIEPLLDYPRSTGTTVTGGYVYRGSALPASFFGRYFFADFGSGRVFSFAWQPNASGGATVTNLMEHTAEIGSVGAISSFAVDLSGELYLVVHSGRVIKLVADAPRPAAPTNLLSLVTGRTVMLRWTASSEATQYRVDVGSQPGASNLGSFDVGALTSLTATSVPDGTYYVRVRAIGPGGISDPSNEVAVTVGTAPCTGPPAPLTGLTFSTSGRLVVVTWSAPGNLTAIALEVGSAPGLSNLAIFTLDPVLTGTSATAAPGTYYVRLRAVNRCGASVPSNELIITVQ
jgi:glucose/arabinose dehydrogenase